MLADDFYTDDGADRWGAPVRAINVSLLRQLRAGPVPPRPDTEVAVGLARLVHDDLMKFGTGGGEDMTDAHLAEALLALRAICDRLSVPYTVPFRDFTGFKAHWLRVGAGGSGGYAARRGILASIFDPMHDHLEVMEQQSLVATLATAISTQPRVGWPGVDDEVDELRREFRDAITPQDYNGVGLVAVRVLEAISATVYDPSHLRAGETEPPVANTKQRIERFVEVELAGAAEADLRRLVRSAVEFAQSVKHSATSCRRDAGIAADAVLLLANILRRVSEP